MSERGEAGEPPAKRVKTEGESNGVVMDAKQVEAIVLSECKKHQQWLAPPVSFLAFARPSDGPALRADGPVSDPLRKMALCVSDEGRAALAPKCACLMFVARAW